MRTSRQCTCVRARETPVHRTECSKFADHHTRKTNPFISKGIQIETKQHMILVIHKSPCIRAHGHMNNSTQVSPPTCVPILSLLWQDKRFFRISANARSISWFLFYLDAEIFLAYHLNSEIIIESWSLSSFVRCNFSATALNVLSSSCHSKDVSQGTSLHSYSLLLKSLTRYKICNSGS